MRVGGDVTSIEYLIVIHVVVLGAGAATFLAWTGEKIEAEVARVVITALLGAFAFLSLFVAKWNGLDTL